MKEDKKLWQFIGKGERARAIITTEDYLGYDQENDHFVFLKEKMNPHICARR